MKNLKDMVIERLHISKNMSSQDISWEEFCEVLANYLPRKNAKNNTIFVKNTDLTEDIYANSDFHNNKNGKAEDRLICITAIKNPRDSIRLSIGFIAERHFKLDNDDANCYIFFETFVEFKELYKESYVEVMNEFYNVAIKKQR